LLLAILVARSETEKSSMNTTTYDVLGMTCAHCVTSVTTELGGLAGVESVQVELVAGGTSKVAVSSAGPLERATVAAAIDEAGYQLVPQA
jgi:copper chaperone CopZ